MINVSIYNLELVRQGVLTSYISLVWDEGYNTEGMFQLECVLSDEVLELLQLEWYCGISNHDTLMIIKSMQIENDRVVVNGYPATHVFSERVSTTVISNQNAEEAMRQLFSEMDPYPCYELGDLAGLEETFTAQTSDQTLEEYFETIAQACDIGFRMLHDRTAKKLLFTVYAGEENENAKYATTYGNMGDIVYSLSNIDYRNVAIVAGQGEGDDRVTVYAGDTDATGADRREIYVDARSEQQEEDETDDEYEERLVAYGEEKLLEQLQVENISFTMTDDSAEVGDMVFCHIPEINVNVKVRVASIELTVQDNVVSRTITLGTPIVLKRY